MLVFDVLVSLEWARPVSLGDVLSALGSRETPSSLRTAYPSAKPSWEIDETFSALPFLTGNHARVVL